MVQQKVCPVCTVLNRQKLLAFVLQKRRENINFCKRKINCN